MQGVARNFFTLAVIYAVVGMLLGLSMAMSQDHSQTPTHAHIMVLGWVMSSVFAFFYHLVPAARNSKLAVVHFWLSAISSIGMVIGLYVLYGGNPVDRASPGHVRNRLLSSRPCSSRILRSARSGAVKQPGQPAGSQRTDENFSLIPGGLLTVG